MEDLRRGLESRGAMEVVYIDVGRSGGEETKLGWSLYDEAVRDFASLLGSLRGTELLDIDDLVCVVTARSDRFLVFLGGADAEGARSPAARRERLLAALREQLAAAPDTSPQRSLRLAAGHARVTTDPMVRPERAIQQAVSDAMVMSLLEREGTEAMRREKLYRMISEGQVRTVFHPIVRLSDGAVIGHEALTRPLGEAAFESVEELFAFAEASEFSMDFERLCRHTAIRAAGEMQGLGLLFLNASAQALEDPDWSTGSMDELLQTSGLRPRDVVIEITERVAIVRREEFQAVLRAFKERGYRVAVDDMGAGYASLQSLASIEPDFLKFDISLVHEIDRSSIKRSLLESLRELAEKIHARVIAEGVEREEERQTLISLGIELGQGYHFHPATV
jgi:EAL domain-containing protein (putative c-di-GMP-specific phosphodiesterase class I)